MMLTLALSAIIGLLLGLLGGGGSILTVPMLVYVLNLEAKTAIVTSFVVVGISSILALIPHARRGSVCWKSGLYFGLIGMVGAFGGGRLAANFSSEVLMSLFGLICLLTGIFMIGSGERRVASSPANETIKICPTHVPYFRVSIYGFLVGGLTGMVGVGGGFLIVPALTLLIGFPMQGAVGTSLLVIGMNAVAGLGGYSQHISLDFNLTAIVAGGTICGSAIGALLSARVNPVWLRRTFGLMVVLVAIYVLSQSLSAHLLDSLKLLVMNRPILDWLILILLVCLFILRIRKGLKQPAALDFSVVKLGLKH